MQNHKSLLLVFLKDFLSYPLALNYAAKLCHLIGLGMATFPLISLEPRVSPPPEELTEEALWDLSEHQQNTPAR